MSKNKLKFFKNNEGIICLDSGNPVTDYHILVPKVVHELYDNGFAKSLTGYDHAYGLGRIPGYTADELVEGALQFIIKSVAEFPKQNTE